MIGENSIGENITAQKMKNFLLEFANSKNMDLNNPETWRDCYSDISKLKVTYFFNFNFCIYSKILNIKY